MPFFKPNPEKMAKRRDVKGLVGLLASPERALQRDASHYLRQSDRQAVIPHLIRALSDPSTAAEAAALLGDLSATEAVDSLVVALNNVDQEARRRAVAALGEVAI